MIELSGCSPKMAEENPKNWLQAFSLLQSYLKGIRESKKKKVIFIDEFPLVDTMRSIIDGINRIWVYREVSVSCI